MAYMWNKEFETIYLHTHNSEARGREEWSGAVVSRCSDLQNVHHRCCVLWDVAHNNSAMKECNCEKYKITSFSFFQKCGIEKLVDELCAKLKEIQSEGKCTH
jgi:hypothetical protein